MKLILIFGLALALMYSTGCGKTSTPERAVAAFLDNLQKGKHLEAQDQLSAHFKETVMTWAGGIKNDTLKEYYQSERLDKYKVIKLTKSESSARAEVWLLMKDGRPAKDTIELVRENGKWLIAEF